MDIYTLSGLRPGERGTVAEVTGGGVMARRLADLGLLPGATVACAARAPAGDPAAYLIRGAVIALRDRDAARVALEGAPWG